MSLGTLQRKSDIYNTYGFEDKLVFATTRYAELLLLPYGLYIPELIVRS
jgi:hypothetical protein